MSFRDYSVVFENVAVTSSQDLFELTPADDKPIRLMGLTLDNVGGTADSADADSEQIRVTIQRGYTSSGSGGTTPTPAPLHNSIDTAAGFTAEVNNTTKATTGTNVTLAAFGFNVRVGSREFWPEECWPGASQANTTIVVRLEAAPADSVAMSGTLYVREY